VTGDFGGERGRAFRRAALIAALVLSWAVYAGWAPPPSLTMAARKGEPAKSSARVSWQTTP
jgi:hypothetical protein